MFDAGALIYRIQVIGAEAANRAIKDQDRALSSASKTAKQTSTATEDLGKKTDDTSKKQRQAKSDTDALGGSQQRTTTTTKALGQEFTSMSEKGQTASKEVGAGFLGVGAAVSVMVGTAVAKFSSFSGELAQVRTLAHASTEQMHDLSEAALTSGQNIGLSANEVAQAETELVKAGVGVQEQLGGALPGALNLAAAGQIDVAKSTQIAAVAMTQFKLAGKDVPHLADLLAAGADKALGGVDDLGMALNQSGLVASQFGLSIEDTVGTLSAFANAGLLGSDAGTSFKTMLLSLASPSAQAKEEMKKWNIEAYDAQGNFVGITALAGQLENGLRGATQAQRDQALSIIFGTDAIRAANVLYKEGAAGIGDWVNKVNDSGFAAEQAQGKLDSLEGDVTKLGAAFDTALIRSGSAGNDVLREMVQTLTQVVQWYGGLPEPVQAAALSIGVGTAAVALFGGTLLVTVPKVVQFKAAVATLSEEMPRTTAGLKGAAAFLAGPWGIALTAAVALLGVWSSAQVKSGTNVQELTDQIDEQTGALTNNGRATIQKQLQDQGVYDAAKKAGISIKEVNAAVFEGGDALDSYNKKSADYYASVGVGGNILRSFSGEASALADGVNVARKDIEDAKTAHENLAEAQESGVGASKESTSALDENGKSADTAAAAYADAAKQASDLHDQIDQLIESVNKANGVGQDAVSANAAYQQSLSSVQDTIEKAHEGQDGYSTSLDQATVAGSKNAQMFADLAAKSQDAAKAQYDLDHNTDAYRANLEAGRQTLIDNMTALTGNHDEAVKLADAIYRIPSAKEFKILADTASAQSQINTFITTNDGRRLRMYVDAYGGTAYQIPGTNVRFNAQGAIYPTVEHFAGGGIRERHVAQIARAGTMRVWAEAETGGEAYIPLSPSKRDRSTAILQTVATQFGYQLVPAEAQSFADGSAPRARRRADDRSAPQVTQHIYPSEGMNERDLAGKAADELERRLRR
ncbi:MAG: phage tail tape measure protein [Leifsonia sp.]